MNEEGQTFEKKSLRVLEEGIPELAKGCVAFANAAGGVFHIGVEDGDSLPPATQGIDDRRAEHLERRIPQVTTNVGVSARKMTASNGGEYIELRVFPSKQSIAATSDGRYFIRVSDESRPLMPDELARLINDKTAYVWETQTARRIPSSRVDVSKRDGLLSRLRSSKRVSDFVREKADENLLDYYLFTQNGRLTNLGVLWIGQRQDRAVLRYAPAIQVIKFDANDRKVNKWLWDDFSLNPLELIEAVWHEVPDWRECQEIPDGLLRTTVPHYDEVVVRELLANALVHRPYTQSGDIFLNLYPDRMEIHNPGLLPLGVTPRNILHTTIKRNEQLAKVFYDLGLMEREGSGYDRIYEVLVSAGKLLPEVREGNDRVAVTVYKRIIKPVILDFVAKANETYEMTQKETIALGLLAQHEALTAIHLCELLALEGASDLRPWLERLVKWALVKHKGRTKGIEYYIDSDLLRKLDFQGATTLKGIEKHRLRELILRDLKIYKEASTKEIQARIGEEIPIAKIRNELASLVNEEMISRTGAKKSTRYHWTG